MMAGASYDFLEAYTRILYWRSDRVTWMSLALVHYSGLFIQYIYSYFCYRYTVKDTRRSIRHRSVSLSFVRCYRRSNHPLDEHSKTVLIRDSNTNRSQPRIQERFHNSLYCDKKVKTFEGVTSVPWPAWVPIPALDERKVARKGRRAGERARRDATPGS